MKLEEGCGFETTDYLECLQILDILIYGRRGVATMSCCHGIQVFYLRNSLNFHKNGSQVRIKA